VGGSCFPKDIAALRAVAREYQHEAEYEDATMEAMKEVAVA
jgi:UDP-glucose 6-dehydrogenase